MQFLLLLLKKDNQEDTTTEFLRKITHTYNSYGITIFLIK